MNEQEKAALLATGEKKLTFIENCMDESLQEKNFSLALRYDCQYDGAACMLKELGLISYEDFRTRSRQVYDRYLAAKYPEMLQKEDA